MSRILSLLLSRQNKEKNIWKEEKEDNWEWENREKKGRKLFFPFQSSVSGRELCFDTAKPQIPIPSKVEISTDERKSWFSTQSRPAVFTQILQHPVKLRCPTAPGAQPSTRSLASPRAPGLNHPGLHPGRICTPAPSRASPRDALTSGRAEKGAGSVLARANPRLWALHPQPAQGWRSPGVPRRPPRPPKGGHPMVARPSQPTLAGRQAPGGIRLCPDVLTGPRPTPSSWTPLASCVRQRNDAPSYCK